MLRNVNVYISNCDFLLFFLILQLYDLRFFIDIVPNLSRLHHSELIDDVMESQGLFLLLVVFGLSMLSHGKIECVTIGKELI